MTQLCLRIAADILVVFGLLEEELVLFGCTLITQSDLEASVSKDINQASAATHQEHGCVKTIWCWLANQLVCYLIILF